MIGNGNEPTGLKRYKAIVIRLYGVKCHRLLPRFQMSALLLTVLSLRTKGQKSITVQTAQGLRRSHSRIEYALQVKRKPRRLGIG
jgi:hypothetical protein